MEKTSVQFIKEVAKVVAKSKLKNLETAQAKAAIEGVMRTVGLSTKEEVLLFCAYFDKTCQGRSMDFEDISHYIDCSTLEIMEMLPSVKTMLCKGYLKCTRNNGYDNSLATITRMNIVVEDTVFGAIIGNTPVVPKPATDWGKTKLDRYEFCDAVGKMVEDEDVDTELLVEQVLKLEEANLHHDFINTLRASVAEVTDRILFYDIAYDYYRSEGKQKSGIVRTLRDIHSDFSKYMLTKKDILEDKHILVTEGLIEKFDDKEMRLTQKGCVLFFADDLKYFIKNRKCEDIYTFLAMVSDFMRDEDQYCSRTDYEQLSELLTSMENENRHIEQLHEIGHVLPTATDRAMLYVLGADMVNGRCTSLSTMAKIFCGDKRLKAAFNQFRLKQTLVQNRGYAELETKENMMGEHMVMKLTDKGMEVLLGEDAKMFYEEIDDKDLITPDKVAEKKLFFTEDLDRQLSLIRSSLKEETFNNLRNRLEEQHLPKGVAVLLYGEPGTGKTESVMQIAKETGRAVMHVDISNTKSMWFGESEKIIKKVFADYRRLCEHSKVKPILLFNEADAIFSKRKDVSHGNVTQTENAIQNIILEEMENLDGILVATTNLADNLDAAFERRFLFKVRFDKPTTEAKKSIWQSKLSMLTNDEAMTLAMKYDLSGGQIDNIVRKVIMNEIVKGETPTLEDLKVLCKEEKLNSRNAAKIGFC